MAARRKRYASSRARSRTPKKRGEPNGLEQHHHDTYISPRLGSEYAEVIGYECMSFALFVDAKEKRVMYTPDWAVRRNDGEIELHETKGGRWMGDSRIRFKAASARYPQFHWRAFVYSGKRIKTEEAA